MPNINLGAEKHIFHMATNTYRNVAKTLREAPNTYSYGHLKVLSYWNGLCIDPVNRVWSHAYKIYWLCDRCDRYFMLKKSAAINGIKT